MAKKRKHEDEGETAQTAPAKKSKSSQRSERRRERLKEGQQKPRDSTVLLGEHETKPRSKQVIKRAERKQLRKAAASGTLVEVDDEVEGTETVLPEDAVDHNREDAERERRKQRNKDLKKRRHREEQERSVSKAARRQKQKQQPKSIPRATWTSSDPAAGRFIAHDPIFVRDASGEDYLIAAVARELQVLSIETSLLVRTLPAPEGMTIKAFAVESPESNLVHIAYNNGGVSLWDWTNDLPAWSIASANGEVGAISAVRPNDDDAEAVVSYVASVDGVNVVKVHDLDMHKAEKAVDSIQVLGKAEYVLARGRDVLVIGRKQDDKKYAWIELPLTKPATCMDARMVPVPSGSKKAKRHPQLQLAIGNEDGQIQLYDDVSSLLSPGQQQALPAPRILHWHRSAVSSVKLSPDGTYLISGGKETVLVIWQLETGRKQYLPHLTSEIERITVNPQGDRYALHMGDNSIMVLSTAELKPVANFAGLQMPTMGADRAKGQAVALHPKNPRQFLLTVPPTQPKSASEHAPRPYLQTFDLRSARHISRQALTRNNATDFNIGPEGNTIFPPDVHQLAISQDGEWLATVDEWMPPTSDLLHLAPDRAGLEEARRWRREVFVKFWHWDASLEMWTLSTRADGPHARAGSRSYGHGRVVALVSDPSRNAFATVGEDDCVKIWKPKTRERSGVAVKTAQDVALTDFVCKRSVQLSSNKTRADAAHEHTAVAAYSGDGSLLAVSSSSPITSDESIPAVTFVDTATGAVKLTTTGLSDGTAITAIAFLGQHFISVTQKAAFVWDLVNMDTMMQKIKLPGLREPMLVVNEADLTFALVTAAEGQGKMSRVAVHTTKHTNRLYKQEFETDCVKILNGGKGSRGFVLLFADATVRTLLPTGSTTGNTYPTALMADAAETAGSDELATAGAAGIVQGGKDEDWADLVASSRAVKQEVDAVQAPEASEEDDRPVVTPEQLADALGVGESHAMPPVQEMFRAVVGLFARRPQ